MFNMNIPLGAVTCIAAKAGMIYDPYFEVTVPIIGLQADTTAEGVTAKTTITAKNCTDYRIKHEGIIDMEATQYKITKSVLEADPPGVPTHAHESMEPFHGDGVVYSKLNEVAVNVGDKMIGFFLDGDSKNLVIIHIFGKVPIGGAVQVD